MSVKHSLLALLERGPAYGYQLRAAFESATGNTWPLNIGQVYTTLNRLERDELVEAMPENESGQRPYRITESGRRHLAGWFASPVQAADRPRDELTIKLALAVTTPGVDVADVIQRQRSATLRLLQEYTRLKAAEERAELAWRLVLESMIFRAEAEIRWLDHTESVVARSDLPAPSPFDVISPGPDSAALTNPELDQSETH
jgi:DNA-binding PadR family transcriptional regulator